MRYAILSIIMLASITSSARAQSDDLLLLRQCQTYDECTIVWGGCNDIAINKRFVEQFTPSSVCAQTTPHDPGAVPTCEDNKCVVVTTDKKDGSVN